MSQNFYWTLLSFQPLDCRPLESIPVYFGTFAPDFAPGFAPGIYSKTFGLLTQRSEYEELHLGKVIVGGLSFLWFGYEILWI